MVLEKIKLALTLEPGSRPIFKGLAAVFTGKVLATGMGFIATIIAARVLGPHDYGLFSVFMAVLVIAVFFLGKNLDTGLVKFYGYYSGNNPDLARASIRVAFNLRIVAGIGGVVTGYLLSNSIAIFLFHNPDLVFPLKMAFLGAFGMSLWYFSLTIFQAREEFLKYSVLEAIFNLLKAVCILGLLLVGKLTLANAILAVTAVIYLNMVLGFVSLPRGVLGGRPSDKKIGWNLVGFCKWIFLAEVICILYYKQDILILNYFREPDSVGLYSAAFTALVLVEYLTSALVVVQLPAASRLSCFDEYKGYIRRSLIISSMLSVIIIPMFFFAEPLMITFFSDSYNQSVRIFRILFFGFAIRIFTHPLYLLFMSIDRPKILAAIFGSVLVLNLCGNFLFVPIYGEIGAAWVTLTSRIVEGALICLSVYSFVFLKNAQVLQGIKIS